MSSPSPDNQSLDPLAIDPPDNTKTSEEPPPPPPDFGLTEDAMAIDPPDNTGGGGG